jgi:hypothetical protein
LRGYLASFEAHTDELRGWSEAEVTYVALRSTRAELPDLAHVRAAVELAIDHHDDSHPTVWTAAATMHLIDIEHWRTLAARPLEQHKLDQWLASSGRLHLIEYDAYQLDMLLATRELTGEQCERVAARIEASWPAPGDDRALDRAALCVRLFDTLGRQDAIERHRADVHELLRRHWISGRGTGPFAKIGGFSSYPAKLRTSFDEATWRAVDLIARCGAPPEIDMRLLHGYLRTESAAHGLIGETYAELKATERAALLRLEREIGLPSRHWLATLLGERVLIGSTLIVALCFLAIRFAAPTGDDALAHARSRTEP